MSEKTELSHKIYHARVRKGYTQERLAEAVSVSTRWIQYIERGDFFPSGRLLYRLVRVLDMDLRDNA